MRVENEQVNYEWEHKAQGIVDINDDDDDDDDDNDYFNKVEEPTEHDNKIFIFCWPCILV